ncbi:Hypothetical predicted protein [Podarcis lilfordi]|uniref:PH domain-containing protein n=1 Tax=Podarcis lilfordi TaxID=74358 RepID=A0AA35JPB2_9SAUR|nr:Hypothetical predicted protein [Podarcis lilfordi]
MKGPAGASPSEVIREGELEKRSDSLFQLWKKKAVVLSKDSLSLFSPEAGRARGGGGGGKELRFGSIQKVDCVERTGKYVYFTIVTTDRKEIDFRTSAPSRTSRAARRPPSTRPPPPGTGASRAPPEPDARAPERETKEHYSGWQQDQVSLTVIQVHRSQVPMKESKEGCQRLLDLFGSDETAEQESQIFAERLLQTKETFDKHKVWPTEEEAHFANCYFVLYL